MKEHQAREIISHIEQDYAGRILATLDTEFVRGADGYRVKLLLRPGQRQVITGYPHQVPGVLDAWRAFWLEVAYE